MEEEAVTMPTVDISFAPTKAFVGAFGEEEARKQGERFTQPSWAQKMYASDNPQVKITKLSDEQVKAYGLPANPLLTRDEAVAVEAEKVPPAAFVVVGGIFLAGAATALFVAWRLGMLSTATSTLP